MGEMGIHWMRRYLSPINPKETPKEVQRLSTACGNAAPVQIIALYSISYRLAFYPDEGRQEDLTGVGIG